MPSTCAQTTQPASPKKNTGIFSFYTNNNNKIADFYKKIRPQITVNNLFLALLLTAIVSFVLHSVFNAICYVNLFFIAYRTLFSKNKPNSPDKSFYRQAALLGTLSTVIFDFIFPPASLLFFLLTVPLTLLILKDLAQQFVDIPKKPATTSYAAFAADSFRHCLQSATNEWAYTFITAPYIHKTLFSALSQLSALPAISNQAAFKLLFTTTSLSYLPSALATLSLIGGLGLVFEHQEIAMGYLSTHFDFIKQRWSDYTVDKAHENPTLFATLLQNLMSRSQPGETSSAKHDQTETPSRCHGIR